MMKAKGRATTPKEAWVGLAILFVVALFNYIDRTIISILQEPIKRDLGLSDAQLGALTGLSFALFYTTLALPVARIADRMSRRYVICIALAIWSAMTGFSGLATSFLMLLIFRIGVAAGEAGCVPTSHSLLSDYFPQSKRATAIAIWGLSLPLGAMIGYASGGWLTQTMGWREAFFIVGFTGVALAPIVFFVLREPIRGQFDSPEAKHAEPPPLKEALATLWRLKAFRLMTLGGAAHAYMLHTASNWNAPFYARVHGLQIGEIAFALALIAGIGGGVGTFLGGYLADRVGKRDVRNYMRIPALAGLLATPIALGQYFTADPSVSFLLGGLAFGLLHVYQAPLVATAQSLVGPGMRAFTSATLVLVVNILGMGLGPFVTGAVSDLLGAEFGMGAQSLRYAIATGLICTLLAALLFYLASGHLTRELPQGRADVAPDMDTNAEDAPFAERPAQS